MFRIIVCLGLLAAASPTPPSATAPARATIDRAIEAMGGKAALDAVARLQIETIGHEFFIDQSEQPEGPFIVRYLQTSEMRDVTRGRSRTETQQRFVQVPAWSGSGTVTIVDADAAVLQRGDRSMPAGRQAFEEGRERLALAPERVLFTALDAADLAAAPDVTLQDVVQHVVTFTWRGRRVRLLLNSGDGLPTAVEVVADDPSGIWGLVRQTTFYSVWTLLPGGVRYPLQADRAWNGVTRSSSTVLKIDVNPAIADDLFAIAAEAKKAFVSLPAVSGIAALTFDAGKRVEVAPGVAQYAGSWNVGLVEQPDGLVVLEAPIGSRYSSEVLDEIARRYPGRRVKAVITTSDAWPHLGGVREYVARGIPVYALGLNRPILQRLLAADYAAHPDTLARAPRAPRVTFVSSKTVIGAGDTRLELYPVRGENGERMMAAYFPALKLLYTSDEIMRERDGSFFMPELLLEVRDLVRREHLDVDRIFGMHIGPTPWSAIDAAIAAAAAPRS
jgi:hypothetical protein